MSAEQIFNKTAKGQQEVDAIDSSLSMKERRVLILVNGDKDTDKLSSLSLCNNVPEILATLLEKGFIQYAQGSAPTDEDDSDITPTSYEATEFNTLVERLPTSGIAAREFMCNTLLTFANRVRVATLVDEINTAKDLTDLKATIKPWYRAISETPGGMYQADELRQEVLQLIALEESGNT